MLAAVTEKAAAKCSPATDQAAAKRAESAVIKHIGITAKLSQHVPADNQPNALNDVEAGNLLYQPEDSFHKGQTNSGHSGSKGQPGEAAPPSWHAEATSHPNVEDVQHGRSSDPEAAAVSPGKELQPPAYNCNVIINEKGGSRGNIEAQAASPGKQSEADTCSDRVHRSDCSIGKDSQHNSSPPFRGIEADVKPVRSAHLKQSAHTQQADEAPECSPADSEPALSQDQGTAPTGKPHSQLSGGAVLTAGASKPAHGESEGHEVADNRCSQASGKASDAGNDSCHAFMASDDAKVHDKENNASSAPEAASLADTDSQSMGKKAGAGSASVAASAAAVDGHSKGQELREEEESKAAAAAAAQVLLFLTLVTILRSACALMT